ncbi:hypothetical protein MSAN_01323800 [Mycena sanguinolenta]|uniref:Uncharacterized protein n=1 Tax=Mycena sanguinolenta TaxID=230812 RepID=A0A8H6YE28_9AGAR|nr:hypothetical protein MSAN_01323800 [Mycena sanguinolenta]
MADVRPDTARLIALFVSCILYGILLTTFIPCLRSLIFSASQSFQLKPRHEIKFPVLVATTLMFLVSSFSTLISLQNVIDAFINYQGPGGALEFYETLHVTVNSGWTFWMPAVEDSIQVILGDALLIYRCYVLYDRNWRVIAAPFLAWVSLIATTIASSFHEITLKKNQSIDDPAVIPILSSALLLTFATSVITTFLIIRKLLKVRSDLNARGAIRVHTLTRIAMIFFETGLIYTLSVFFSLGIYLSRSNLQCVVALAVCFLFSSQTRLCLLIHVYFH